MHKNDKEVIESIIITLLFIIAAGAFYSIGWPFPCAIASFYSVFSLYATAYYFTFRKYEYVRGKLIKTR